MAEVAQIFWKLKGVFPKKVGNGEENAKISSPTNIVFRLHSHLTFVLLLLSSILIFVQQLLGVHIKCLLPTEDLRASAVTTYCFITGTYTIPEPQTSITSHPGVGMHINEEQKFHYYFQWVPFILLMEAFLFYLPHLLWKHHERGKVSRFYRSKASAAYDFYKMVGYNKFYVMVYHLCELGNFLMVLGTFWGTNWFLSGQFQNYGFDYFRYVKDRNLENPMDLIFPKVTKCDFQKFGPSGQIVKYDILCILAVNVINEKIFLGLWVWLISLFVLDSAHTIYRAILFISSGARGYQLIQRTPFSKHSSIKCILSRLGYADWFLLKRISETFDSHTFGEFCSDLDQLVWKKKNKKHLKKDATQESSSDEEQINYEKSNFPKRRKRVDQQSTAAEHLPLYDMNALQELKHLNESLTHITIHKGENDTLDPLV